MSKIIHQIWLQGEKELPKNLQIYKQSVQKYAKDFEIIYWDYSKISNLVKTKFPNFIDKWNSILEDKQSLIKFTDISRWLILYEYGGFYLDRDIELLQDITKLYNDVIQHKITFTKEKVIKNRYAQSPLGFKMYSHIKDRFEFVYQDCFCFANPKQEFFLEFLDHAFEIKENNILDSFSVWSITDFIKKNKYEQIINCLDETTILFGLNDNGVSHHHLNHGWVDVNDDKPWNSVNEQIININFNKIKL